MYPAAASLKLIRATECLLFFKKNIYILKLRLFTIRKIYHLNEFVFLNRLTCVYELEHYYFNINYDFSRVIVSVFIVYSYY